MIEFEDDDLFEDITDPVAWIGGIIMFMLFFGTYITCIILADILA